MPIRSSKLDRSPLVFAASLSSILFAACVSSVDDGYVDFADSGTGTDASTPRPDAAPPNFMGRVYAHTSSELYELAPSTLDVTLVAAFGGDCSAVSITDIAVDNAGEIFGVAGGRVFAIDKETAVCTLLATGTGTYNALSFIPGGENPFGGEELLVGVAASGALFRIDPITGESMEIGNYGAGVSSSGDLVSVRNFGTVATVSFESGEFLARINLSTGYAEQIAPTPGGTYGLGFWGGTVYGFTSGGDIYSIDPTNGDIVNIESGATSWWGAGVTTLAPVIL